MFKIKSIFFFLFFIPCCETTLGIGWIAPSFIDLEKKIRPNEFPLLTWDQALWLSSERKQVIIDALIIDYLENSPVGTRNYYFPIIHIQSNKEQSSWIQIVFTDAYEAINIPWQRFIDTHKDVLPFYTHYNILVDFPFWSYSILYKPFSYWKAHSYNVLVNKKENTIQILQGIEWGYRFLPLSLYPTMIEPRRLSSKEIRVDKLFFQSSLECTHYKIV